ncbi:hypothetical protein GGI42DRAFT_308277 [Trichoderma sp. SZMC 28013]
MRGYHQSTDADPDCSATLFETFLWQDRPSAELQIDVGTEDIEWSCSASLPEASKLGSTDVICEGYASSDDPYVLKGSCGVEYRLILTGNGKKQYPDVANPNGRWFSDGEGGTNLGA